MKPLSEIPTPALLLDLGVLENNLRRMADRAEALGVRLRPHMKTHKCVEIGLLQRQLGIAGATVATLYEARVFADHDFADITWAFPVILSRIPEVQEMSRHLTLRLVVDSRTAVDALCRPQPTVPLHVLLKVDCGYHRAGVDPASPDAVELARTIADSPDLVFDGILTHSGQAYHRPGTKALAEAAEQERRVMAELADRLRHEGISVPTVSVGSTPAMSAAASLEGCTEARPGNYALFDYTQCVLGSCRPSDCAATVLASVVSTAPDHCVVDAGALALSVDRGSEHASFPTMGRIYADYQAGELEPELHVTSLSQEHGFVSQPRPVGDRLRILPNHSCLTVACFDNFHVVRNDQVVDRWRIWRGR